MTSHSYLEELLVSQRLDERRDEWKALDTEAMRIEAHPAGGLSLERAHLYACGVPRETDHDP